MSVPPPSQPASSPIVLHVDDEPINLRVFEANFAQRFRIVSCASGEEALRVLAEREGEVGLVLADHRMPGMTGVELLEQVRLRWPEVQRMLLTAYSDVQVVMDAVNRGQISRYFVKPWVKDVLSPAIQDGVQIFSLQATLRETQLRMLTSERLATIGQVAAGIAHELRNPVGWISQNIEALSRQLDTLQRFVDRHLADDPDPAVASLMSDLPALLGDVREGARHISDVIAGVREQAVTRVEGPQACDLAEVAHFAVKLARASLEQRARIKLEGPSILVNAGRARLAQVLINLIVNAGQALQKDRPGLIRVEWRLGEDHVLLTVTDNGTGIPGGLLEKVFEPMFSTKAPGQGTGLGLPISRDLVRTMGGELTLRSTEGEGTEVAIRLLRAAAPAAA